MSEATLARLHARRRRRRRPPLPERIRWLLFDVAADVIWMLDGLRYLARGDLTPALIILVLITPSLLLGVIWLLLLLWDWGRNENAPANDVRRVDWMRTCCLAGVGLLLL